MFYSFFYVTTSSPSPLGRGSEVKTQQPFTEWVCSLVTSKYIAYTMSMYALHEYVWTGIITIWSIFTPLCSWPSGFPPEDKLFVFILRCEGIHSSPTLRCMFSLFFWSLSGVVQRSGLYFEVPKVFEIVSFFGFPNITVHMCLIFLIFLIPIFHAANF